MDTARLLIWLMGVMLIVVGLPLYYLGRYFEAPEGQKKQKARDIKVVAIIWMMAGVVIYLAVLVSIFFIRS